MFFSSKMFGPYSTAFRQWRATHSHCSLIHGYGIKIQPTFEAATLDDMNWVMDFGALKPLDVAFRETFDHKLVIASDDPEKELFRMIEARGLCALRILPTVGCEAFAQFAASLTENFVGLKRGDRVRVSRVEVFEHEINSAGIYIPTR